MLESTLFQPSEISVIGVCARVCVYALTRCAYSTACVNAQGTMLFVRQHVHTRCGVHPVSHSGMITGGSFRCQRDEVLWREAANTPPFLTEGIQGANFFSIRPHDIARY